MADSAALTHEDVTRRVDARHWRVVAGRLHATFRTGDFVTGHRFVGRVTEVAEELDHHPDVVLRYPAVHVALVSHDAGALTARDVALAARVGAIADEMGIEAAPDEAQAVGITVGTVDPDVVRPVWRAALAYADDERGDLVDPAGLGPAVRFGQTDDGGPGRTRVEVELAHDVAEARVRAAVEAGATVVGEGPGTWTLADADGNEVRVRTWRAG